MKNRKIRASTPATRGRVTAASLIVGGAVGFFSLGAIAAPATPASSIATAAAAETIVPSKAEPIQTAPSLRDSGITAGATEASPGEPGTRTLANEKPMPGAAGGVSNAGEEDVLWMLDNTTRPWPLIYSDPSQLNGLYLSLPTEKQIRIMLPGHAADAIDHVRFTVNRYITDNIGNGAMIRGRQLETVNQWVENTNRQQKLVSKDPWAVYQFNKEARAMLQAFKDKVLAQTTPSSLRMAEDIRRSVEQISPLMEATTSYEQKTQWYNVLVQLKEGMGLYQARVGEADAQTLAAIAAYENENPFVPRPQGKPPRPDSPHAPVAEEAPTSAVAMTAPVVREPAQAPVKHEQGSQVGGLIVLMGMGAAVVGLFMKLRRRISKKGASATSDGK